jgi:hypothetical protein
MDNFYDLFKLHNAEFDNGQPFDKEEWLYRKFDTHRKLFESINETACLTLSNPRILSDYLSLQSRLGRTTLSNTLLVLAQKPDATCIMSYDDWERLGRNIKRNEKPLLILEPIRGYEHDNAWMKVRIDAKAVFDLSQTQGKLLRGPVQASLRSRLRALVTDSPFPVVISDEVVKEYGAQHSKERKAVYVTRDLDGETLFAVIARELASVETMTGDCTLDGFIEDCAASIICQRYGINPPACHGIPESISSADADEKQAVLEGIHEAACEIIERMDINLYAERQQQRSQPER